MSIVENLEKIWKNVKDISDNLEKKYNRRHVDKIIRILASLILTYIILSKLFNWEVLCSNIKMELWNEALRLMVKKYIYKLCLFWLIYRLLLFRLFKIICINIDKTDKTESLPIVFTIDDIVDFLCSVYFLIYAINELIEYNNGISSMGNMISVIAIGYLFCVYAEWLYVQNSNNWYFVSREYTYYYDANNKRIPKDAYVIYRSIGDADVPIYKINGDINLPYQPTRPLVITINDLRNNKKNNEKMISQLMKDMNDTFIFLGYSFQDENEIVTDILDAFQKNERWESVKEKYVILPNISEDVKLD